MVLGMLCASLIYDLVMLGLWIFDLISLAAFINSLLGSIFCLWIYWLNQRKRYKLASQFFVLTLFVGAFLRNVDTGVGHPTVIGYALVVLASGMLLSTRAAFGFALVSALSYTVLGYLHPSGPLCHALAPIPILISDGITIGLDLTILALFYFAADQKMRTMLCREQALTQALQTQQDTLTQHLKTLKRTENERADLLVATQEQHQITESLRKITLILTAQTQLDDVLKAIVQQAAQLVPYDAANIALLEGNHLCIAYLAGYPENISNHPATPSRPLDTLP